MHSPNIRSSKSTLRMARVWVALGLACFAVGAGAREEEKKNQAPPKAAPARPGPPAGAPHGPTTGGGASHPGGGAPGEGHPTTNNPGGGHPTTSNPGGGRPTTGNPGGGRPTTGNAGGRPGAGGMNGGRGGPTPSRTFAGHPTPAGGHEMHAANGAVIRTRADGSRSDVHDVRRGMDIHHGLDGNRRIVVERPDHSRIFAERGGRGYVQHPYMYHGREFGQRTYFEHGHAYAAYYQRYPYHGVYLEVYAPVRYYPVGFYGYAYNPWAAPVPYAWGWGGNPWYGYYGGYFAPYPVYAGPAFWLTDYLIATSLQASYAAQAAANAQAAQAANGPPALTPDVKQMIADEVKLEVQQETAEAQANAQNQSGGEQGVGGVAQLMSDGRPHVFVAGSDLDLVDAGGRECMVSEGDVMQVNGGPPGDSPTVNATILASKGGAECTQSANVSVAVNDLQEMQNHMRETVDKGMAELQAKQGHGGLPRAPAGSTGAPVEAAFAAGAPPPDANAGAEINQQAQAADQAEKDDSSAVAGGGGGAGAGGPPVTIALGQSTDDVVGSLGQPSRIVDLGAKKIYTYPDMKITFMNGKVSDVQ